ncbi:unnamed protein product [Moneuplotes crassus]|uniref:Uncharacterized protein n=1 Tax=Euplotes crassus TaxID=5936 RepID=A0AAD1UQS7_EUPCR|nr:unnamed protein product [Moneuplotes crassus]
MDSLTGSLKHSIDLGKKLLKVNRKYKLSLNSPTREFPMLKKCNNIRKISLNQSNEGTIDSTHSKLEKRKLNLNKIQRLFSPARERMEQNNQPPQRKPLMFRRLNRQNMRNGVLSEEPKIRNLALQRLQLAGMDEKVEMIKSPAHKKMKEDVFSFKSANRTLRAFSPTPQTCTPNIRVGRTAKVLLKRVL